MTKADLIKAVAEAANTTMTTASAVLDSLAAQAAKDLSTTGEALLPGIGKLKIAERAARTGRNPQTGEAVDIPARKAVKFKVAKALTDAVE